MSIKIESAIKIQLDSGQSIRLTFEEVKSLKEQLDKVLSMLNTGVQDFTESKKYYPRYYTTTSPEVWRVTC